MAENRTNKAFRNKFRAPSKTIGGFVNKPMYVPTAEDIKKKEEGVVRGKLQLKIRDYIKEGCSTRNIKESLNIPEYKIYQQYIDKWIENWLMKLNPNVKIRILQLLNMGSNEEKILKVIQLENKEMFELYDSTIKQAIETEIQLREGYNKEEEER